MGDQIEIVVQLRTKSGRIVEPEGIRVIPGPLPEFYQVPRYERQLLYKPEGSEVDADSCVEIVNCRRVGKEWRGLRLVWVFKED